MILCYIVNSITFWMKEAPYYYSVQATRGGILSRKKKRKNMKLQDGPPSSWPHYCGRSLSQVTTRMRYGPAVTIKSSVGTFHRQVGRLQIRWAAWRRPILSSPADGVYYYLTVALAPSCQNQWKSPCSSPEINTHHIYRWVKLLLNLIWLSIITKYQYLYHQINLL